MNRAFDQSKLLAYLLPLIIILLAVSTSAQGQNTKYSHIQLPLLTKDGNHWQNISVNPLTNSQFFVSNNSGQIQLLDSEPTSNKLLIDVAKFYPQLIQLTAFATHPSFKLEQQNGYLTFYTAHTEPVAKISAASKIKAYKFQQNTPFELVLTQWQLSKNNSGELTVNSSSRQEILRISAPSEQLKIKQLTFNPFVQPWQDAANHLFIVLTQESPNSEFPLYSGAILRIALEKLGNKQYRIPESNAAIDNGAVNNEILIANLGAINSIHWFKKNPNDLYIRHQNNQQQTLSKILMGDEFTSSSEVAEQLYNTEQVNSSNSIVYRGEQLKKHRNKMLYLVWRKQWLLIALSSQPPYQQELVLSLEKLALPATAQLALTTDHQDELLILNQSGNSAIALYPQTAIAAEQTDATNEQGYAKYLMLFCALVLICALLYLPKRSTLSLVKKLLHNQYARFEVDESNKHLVLFNRHQSDPACHLPLNTLVKSTLYLNNRELCQISKSNETAFSNDKEHQIIAALQTEKREKMIDDRVRKYELELVDQANKTYRICTYCRKGNQRLTKNNFDDASLQLIDWCWLFSRLLHPENTEKRKITVKPVSSHVQAKPDKARQQAKTKVQPTDDGTAINKSLEKTATTDNQQKPAQQAGTPPVTATFSINEMAKQDSNELSMVEALEKLAQLRQQNLLSEQEFEQAKSKILSSRN